MVELPEVVIQAWEHRQGPLVVTTVSKDGEPNAIYCTQVKLLSRSQMGVADHYFSKTRANLDAGSRISLLFVTDDGKAYQIKGSFEYHTSGERFQDMKTWVNPTLPGRGLLVVNADAVYTGAQKLA